MKKTLAILLALALCAGLSGCGHFVSIMPGTEPVAADATPTPEDAGAGDEAGFRETPLLDFMGWIGFAGSYYDDTPVALSIQVGDSFASPIFDRASIITACDTLRAMTVTGRAADPDPTAARTVFTLTMENGDQRTVTFLGSDVSLTGGTYTVTGGDALWRLSFPGYGGSFDIFDLHYSDAIRSFADQFYENTPVSVGRRQNGGATLTSKDPAVVQQVFSILDNATIQRVEMNPDQNIDLTQTTDYVFTMPDASTRTISFAGPCLAVTASEAYGPVYYWLQGTENLPYVTVLPETTIPTFDGGQLTALREDIAQAQQAAAGTLDGVTVLGVYVDYNISGHDPGYLTLSGSVANSFIQQVTSINASSETVPAAGDSITVFVTLSDEQSVPIMVFAGDSIQQVVGVNYACDANAMANLRSTILQLAQDSSNVGLVEGSGTN